MAKRRMAIEKSAEYGAANEPKAIVLQLFLTLCVRPQDSCYALFCADPDQTLTYVCSSDGALDNISVPSDLSLPPEQLVGLSNIHSLLPGTTLHHWIAALSPIGDALWCPIEGPGGITRILVLWIGAASDTSGCAAEQLHATSMNVSTLLQSWPDGQERCRELQLLLNSLEELSEEVTCQEDLREILLKTCIAVARCLSFAEIQVYVLDEDRTTLQGMWCVDIESDQRDLSATQITLENSTIPLAQVARGDTARWLSALNDSGALPTAILPLRSGGEIVGVMTVSNSRQKGIITEEQLQGLLPFAAQAATTVRAAVIRNRLRLANQRANAIDASRKSFERDMIHSVTDGKLNLCETGEIEGRLGDRVLTLSVRSPSEVSQCRQAISQAAVDAGMSADRKGDFDLCVGEVATNCVQHGGGGHLELYLTGSLLQIRVCDGGPGIHSSLLPRATLQKGYSTKTSLGVGFSVIINLCDHLYLSTSEGGTDILVEMGMDRKTEEDLLWDQLGLSMESVA